MSQFPNRRRVGRQVFFSHRDFIQEQVSQGMTLVSIYEPLSEELGITYSQFARYVSAYITKPEKLTPSKSRKRSERLISKSTTRPEPFRVNRNPRKEDYV